MESPHDTNSLWYFNTDLIYMLIKSKILIKCNAKEIDCWNFHKDWFSNFNVECVFLVGYHTSSFTNIQRSLLVLSQLSTPTSSLFTVSWTLLMSLSDAKTVVSSEKWTKHIWLENLCMSYWYPKEKVLLRLPFLQRSWITRLHLQFDYLIYVS